MATCGASDSVITHTSISEELQVPNILFSISLHRGVLLYRLMLLFSAQYHTLWRYPGHGMTATEYTPAEPTGWEREEMEEENPLDALFPFYPRVCRLGDEERGPFISICHALIYISHIYLHILLFFFWKRKDNSAKPLLVVAWLQLLSFPFSALYGVCQTVDLNEEKSLMTRRPSHLIKSL